MRKHNIGNACVKSLPVFLLTCTALLAAATVLWPKIDLIVSGWFYEPDEGFVYADQPALVLLHWLGTYGAWMLALFLAGVAIVTYLRRKPFWHLNLKAWMFLLLGLLIAPGLVGNLIIKDHWGRARPREVTEFHGVHEFSPALIPQADARHNGSFIAGDPAFGFYLSSFGYVVPIRRSRRFFWGGIGLGALFGVARIMMGAHFLSDVVFAAIFMLATTAAVHAAMYGGKATRKFWKELLNR